MKTFHSAAYKHTHRISKYSSTLKTQQYVKLIGIVYYNFYIMYCHEHNAGKYYKQLFLQNLYTIYGKPMVVAGLA